MRIFVGQKEAKTWKCDDPPDPKEGNPVICVRHSPGAAHLSLQGQRQPNGVFSDRGGELRLTVGHVTVLLQYLI